MCDLTQESLHSHIPGAVDLVSLFFVLSAIAPEKMSDALRNLNEVSGHGRDCMCA